VRFLEYINLSPLIGSLVSSQLATLHELQTVYGTEDAYNLLEVLCVDRYNQALAQKQDG
jgi:hypothetical protein